MVIINIMNYSYIRGLDLNLLVTFQALMEERSVTRAARRLNLTQPAVSHALTRLQTMLKDPLLVRAGKGYEPTQRASMAYAQMEKLLPQIEALVRGPQFNPREAVNTFRIAASDYSSAVLLPALAKILGAEAPKIHIQIVSSDGGFRRLETNEIDLALTNEIDVKVWTGMPIRTETLFREEFVCLVRTNHPASQKRLTVQRYLSEKHVGVAIAGGRQRLIVQVLDKLGKERNVKLTLPYFLPVAAIVENSDLVATLPKRIALRLVTPKTKIIAAPPEFGGFNYNQVWHSRDDSDVAHQWLRGVVRQAAAQIAM
jgi:DNA-binding transcriptional LysR family regulator